MFLLLSLNHLTVLSHRITVRVEGGSEETFWEDQEWGHLYPQAGRRADSTQAWWTQVSTKRKSEGMGESKKQTCCPEDFDISCIPAFCVQARSGHPRALWEETGEGQQPLHGAKCHHAAAGGPREGTHEVCKETMLYVGFPILIPPLSGLTRCRSSNSLVFFKGIYTTWNIWNDVSGFCKNAGSMFSKWEA